jgi:starvation-inducible DNA-binding protein
MDFRVGVSGRQRDWLNLDRDKGRVLFIQAALMCDYIDLVAERAVALGGVAHGTLQAAVECTALGSFPVNERDERCLVQDLSRRVERTVEELREAMIACAEEPVTQDLYIQIVRGIEEQRWMLLAHLARPCAAGGG